ncbi:MAG TPA: tRNA (adenosine(37)-N6)-threonylcarbamoyltransferase complex ATPase subunit type 1 TsaE [Clostridiales bacterium]|nr:tRNA (adenosine(37)-N6)-threonylcarbamoyltransferase complex ATPase subunit type 1 TsaE [Clostridiales bacterium]
MEVKKIIHSPSETIEYAKQIGFRLDKGDVIAFRGGLGVGKTTFTRGLAMGLGLPDEVTSPTFALVNEYRGRITLYHFDMYRIESSADLETTGFYDYPLEESVFAIEWAENIIDALPTNTIFITINYIDETTREIIIEGDERFADIGD